MVCRAFSCQFHPIWEATGVPGFAKFPNWLGTCRPACVQWGRRSWCGATYSCLATGRGGGYWRCRGGCGGRAVCGGRGIRDRGESGISGCAAKRGAVSGAGGFPATKSRQAVLRPVRRMSLARRIGAALTPILARCSRAARRRCEPGPAIARPGHAALRKCSALAVLGLLALSALPGSGTAYADTLVSNIGQTSTDFRTVAENTLTAQRFTTGRIGSGINLTSVEVRMRGLGL